MLANYNFNYHFQNLDMIKVREEEAGTAGKVIRKFTYKGEVEIDVADDSKIEVISCALYGMTSSFFASVIIALL